MPTNKFGGDNKIVGATDGTKIGNVDDNLKVVVTTINSAANAALVHRVVGNLLNASNDDDMVVDGSVTAVPYSWSPPTNETWELTSLNVVLGASSDPVHDGFAGGSALTNGLLLEYRTSGSTKNLWYGPAAGVQKNVELNSLFDSFNITGATDSKWLKDAGGRFFTGIVEFRVPIILKNSTGDFVKVTIQDNLTTNGVLFLNVGFHVQRIL